MILIYGNFFFKLSRISLTVYGITTRRCSRFGEMSPMIEAVTACTHSVVEIYKSAQMKRVMVVNKRSDDCLKARGLLKVSIYPRRLLSRPWHNFEAVPRHSMIITPSKRNRRQCLYNAICRAVESGVLDLA